MPPIYRRTRAVLFVLALTTVPATAAALAAPPSPLIHCHQIADSLERLACYDRASGRDTDEPVAGSTADRLNLPDQATTPDETADKSGAPAYEEARTPSMIDTVWAFDADSSRTLITTHQRNYALLGRYTSSSNETPYSSLFDDFGDSSGLDAVEAKLQISFKTRLWASNDRQLGLWLAYTQQSHWQVYNDEQSRPFRETNYMPELFFSYRPGLSFAGFDWNLLNAGYNHQSNGRSGILSRSWDRLFVEGGVERGNLGLFGRLWYRIPENNEDENPDITDYYGYGDLTALYRINGHSLSLKVGGSLASGKGAAEISWVTPPIIGPLRGYVQLFSGYGESLIDYNWYQNTVGIGVALNDLY
ncbi:phospholipase A [Desulfofustis glycolicus]|uniref:Phosphatidylcholine 1-acylhydrolase n=1 Tax=Desulfofustis glycolicus DSM 9705 TaxID=1121409 RepID=A0A1M5S0B0_9BACT|nr:phospholipase A [Desulfofustis glycolicus]MCB2216282.1 phospholipase A [Desulfobulbaceae bacterium]SHH32062.1 phospholipase A1 [Desulfofustis glycolicus DSM 9705]